MAEKTTATARQQTTETFKSFQDEMAKLEAKGIEQARLAIDEMARLSHAQLAWATQIGAEWRRIAFDAMKRATEGNPFAAFGVRG